MALWGNVHETFIPPPAGVFFFDNCSAYFNGIFDFRHNSALVDGGKSFPSVVLCVLPYPTDTLDVALLVCANFSFGRGETPQGRM